MTLTILYFAQLKEEIGLAEETIQLDSQITGKELVAQLGDQYPVVKLLAPSLSLAVNEEYRAMEEIIPEGATVALIPPVSGG